MPHHDLVIRFAGTAGEGVLTTGELLGAILARSGFHVRCTIRYDAEVRGEKLSMSQVRVSSTPILSPGDFPQILVGFGKEAVETHLRELAPGGLLVYDDKAIDEFGDVTAYRVSPPPGIEVLPLPFLEIAWKKVGRTEAKNMVILGSVLEVLGLPQQEVTPLIRKRFGRESAIAAANLEAVELGRQAAASGARRALAPGDGRSRTFLTGNQAVAFGALAAGCGFFAGYPITPASEIMEELARHLPPGGGHVLQLEDEMAALGAVLGASFGGVKAMTATSGPGLSLMSELIDFAAMTELPAVIVDVQRGGPSTGLPTRPEQSDLQQAVFGVHGESPRIVIAARSIADCFSRTREAFSLAERCQTPVILLSDQLLGQSRATVDLGESGEVPIEDRLVPDPPSLQGYQRYLGTASGVSPLARPGTEGGNYLATGLEHNESGMPDYAPQTHRRMSEKRFRKLELIRDRGFRILANADAPRLLLGWGSVCGVLQEAAQRLSEKGFATGALAVERIHPWPQELAAALSGRIVYSVEMNFTSQINSLLRARGIPALPMPWTGGAIAVSAVSTWVQANHV